VILVVKELTQILKDMRYFIVTLDSFNSEGPYTIYYNTINGGTIASILDSTQMAENLTPYDLLEGVTVSVPDDVTKLIVYDNSVCQEYKEIVIQAPPVTYDDFCVTIVGSPFTQGMEPEITQIFFSYDGTMENDRPVYTDSGDTYTVYWSGTTWTLDGFDVGGGSITSTNSTESPINGWVVNGPLSSFYTISANVGECSVTNRASLRVTSYPPTCSSLSDGQITLSLLGGTAPYSYSLDNVLFITDGPSHTFFNIAQGNYNVYAQDANGSYVDFTSLVAQNQQTTYNAIFQNVNPQQGFSFVSCSGNLELYKTSGSIIFAPPLPANIITLNTTLKVDIDLSYEQPGSATLGPFSITASNGNNLYTLSQYVTTPMNAGNIVCGNPSYRSYSGMTGFSTTIPFIPSNNQITFGINFFLDMSNCQIDTKFNCQTIAKIRVRAYLDNIGNANSRACTQYTSRTYDSGVVTINCSNKKC
jgi:hypothetical protein